MIEARVERNDEVIMERNYYEPSLTLEMALKQLELYVVAEGLNRDAECNLKVRFSGSKPAE